MGETASGQDRGCFPPFNLFPSISHPAPQYPVSWPADVLSSSCPPTLLLPSFSLPQHSLLPAQIPTLEKFSFLPSKDSDRTLLCSQAGEDAQPWSWPTLLTRPSTRSSFSLQL